MAFEDSRKHKTGIESAEREYGDLGIRHAPLLDARRREPPRLALANRYAPPLGRRVQSCPHAVVHAILGWANLPGHRACDCASEDFRVNAAELRHLHSPSSYKHAEHGGADGTAGPARFAGKGVYGELWQFLSPACG